MSREEFNKKKEVQQEEVALWSSFLNENIEMLDFSTIEKMQEQVKLLSKLVQSLGKRRTGRAAPIEAVRRSEAMAERKRIAAKHSIGGREKGTAQPT